MAIPIVDILPNISGNHPTTYGMWQIRNDVMIHMGYMPTVEDKLSINPNYPMNITWSPSENAFDVEIEEKHLYRVTICVTDIGSNDAYIAISGQGTIAHNFASFDDVKGQKGTFVKIVESPATLTKLSISVTGTIRTAMLSLFAVEKVSY